VTVLAAGLLCGGVLLVVLLMKLKTRVVDLEGAVCLSSTDESLSIDASSVLGSESPNVLVSSSSP
jgi:hypothetical protein